MKKVGVLVAALIFLLFIPQFAEASSGQLVIINKSTNKLAFFDQGELVKTFPVATGRTSSLTPEGTFPIVNKIKNRPYYTGNIPGGDPSNPLGDRWLGLDARGTYGTTYAIHGNNNASSIGNYVSAGCVRMHNEDVRWLFDRIKLKTNVIILQSSKSFEQIAKDNGYQLAPPINVVLDGKPLQVSEPPFMASGRVLVPMRSIFHALGATVHWDGKTQSITASHNGNVVKLKVGSKQATINGKAVTLDVPPRIVNQQTFVPTRFVSEALGTQVTWNGSTRTVTLTSPAKPEPPKEPVKTAIDVRVNGELVVSKGNGDAFIQSGVTLVPMRDIFQWVGASVAFDAATSTVTATRGEVKMVMKTGSATATVNGSQVTLPKAPFIENGKMYVPARAITDAFTGSIKYDSAAKVLNIDVNK